LLKDGAIGRPELFRAAFHALQHMFQAMGWEYA